MISVIVPVYNVAAYLSACLDSVLAQTYTDIELLVVDDGSTDGSADICDDYACRDARVTVFHQANAGPAAARNRALEVAQGEYIAFIDSDDKVHRQYLEVMLNYINASPEADIVRVSSALCPLVGPLPKHVRSRSISGSQALIDMLYQRPTADSAPWGKLIRHSLLQNQRFPVAFYVYEDLYLMAQLYSMARQVLCVDLPLYQYVKQDSGTLNSQSTRRRDAFDVLQALEAQYMVTGRAKLVRAVRERRLSVSFNILRILSRQPHTDANIVMAHRCWTNICKLRRESLRDSQARFKNRLFSALSFLIKR